jgi:hypothetical protein
MQVVPQHSNQHQMPSTRRRAYNPQSHPHAGRPTKEIDWERVERDLWRGATVQELADSLGITTPTLYQYENFLAIYKEAYANGNISLRRKLWNAAMGGNTTMLIWLGQEPPGPEGRPCRAGERGRWRYPSTPQAAQHRKAGEDTGGGWPRLKSLMVKVSFREPCVSQRQ